MPDTHAPALPAEARAWPPGITRIPYWVYQDAEILKHEQRTLFEGPVWNFLALDAEIPNRGDYRTTFVGSMPVVVVRGDNDAIHAFENRCVHRGALIVLDDAGTAKDFTCAYHAWRYDLEGHLCSVAFQRGVNGKGGMPADFSVQGQGPRRLRTTTIGGLVFGTLSDATPDIDTFLGAGVAAKLRRVLNRPVEILGRFSQPMPNNWKLYAENVRDTYHASLLHSFFTTFRITRFSQAGGITLSENGGHHASATIAKVEGNDDAYKTQGIRSDNDGLKLRDMSFLDSVDEFGDGIQLQILTVFPSLVLQQTHNSLAIRHFLPKGTGEMTLEWTYLGFADDPPEMRRRRLKQANLVGPAGFISLEDGCIGGFVQRAVETAGAEEAVVEMGGRSVETQPTRATEVAVRGFWQLYRNLTGL
ncbi:MAG: Rieske 2Fe-2S domain-containing protein [Acetobacteraceae bacterium]|nr:Rieske 2Fe-2S domain-containing protein [Acetobacteraceae bacterium]